MSASGKIDFDCLDCFAHIAASLDFELKIVTQAWMPPVYIDKFLLRVDGEMNGNVHLHAHAEAEFSASKTVKIIEDRSLGSLTLALGAIPLTISFYGGLTAEATLVRIQLRHPDPDDRCPRQSV